jgi:hypothetical protein
MLAAERVGEAEVDLNRRLYRCIIRASHAASVKDGAESLPVVVPEGKNPPSGSDAERAAREHKIPDFYWAYIDHLAADPDAAAKQFVVECKRLTAPTSDWIYTKEYVMSGIARFISAEHGYGKDSLSGAMVGYLQEISLVDAHAEINKWASGESIPQLSVSRQAGDDSAELDHRLDRSFPESPFHLLHLWTRV